MARFTLPLVVAIALFAVVPLSSSAQQSLDWTIEIDHFEHGPDHPDTRVTRAVRQALERELELRGIQTGDSYLSRLVLDARSVMTSDGEYILVAVVEGGGLTEPVIEAAAENEVWYADKPRPENLEEGSFVRQYMTREVFTDLMRVHGVRLLHFPVDDLQMEMSLYVEDYRDRMTCDDPRDCSRDDGE